MVPSHAVAGHTDPAAHSTTTTTATTAALLHRLPPSISLFATSSSHNLTPPQSPIEEWIELDEVTDNSGLGHGLFADLMGEVRRCGLRVAGCGLGGGEGGEREERMMGAVKKREAFLSPLSSLETHCLSHGNNRALSTR